MHTPTTQNITDIFNHLVDNFISNPNKETLLNIEQIMTFYSEQLAEASLLIEQNFTFMLAKAQELYNPKEQWYRRFLFTSARTLSRINHANSKDLSNYLYILTSVLLIAAQISANEFKDLFKNLTIKTNQITYDINTLNTILEKLKLVGKQQYFEALVNLLKHKATQSTDLVNHIMQQLSKTDIPPHLDIKSMESQTEENPHIPLGGDEKTPTTEYEI